MFFWRSDRCYQCGHDHPWRGFWRGMVAMFVLAFAVLGLLDYQHGHNVHGVHTTQSREAVASSHGVRHRDRPDHAGKPHPGPRLKSATVRHLGRQIRSAGRRHSPTARTSLATAGQGLNWTDFHGIELPASPAAGPYHAGGGLVSGFADTPRGALLAAVNIAVRTAADWGPPIFRPTIANQVTGRNALVLLRAAFHEYAQARRSSGTPTQPTAAEEAYRFLTYAPAAATIDLVTSGPAADGGPVLVVTLLRVVWRRGDWRLIAPPRGNWANASAEISSLAGYTIFPSAG